MPGAWAIGVGATLIPSSGGVPAVARQQSARRGTMQAPASGRPTTRYQGGAEASSRSGRSCHSQCSRLVDDGDEHGGDERGRDPDESAEEDEPKGSAAGAGRRRLQRAHTSPRAAQARPVSPNGGSGSRARASSLQLGPALGASSLTYAPAGPTPSVKGSHQSSKVGWSISTTSAVSWTARSPAASKSSVRWPARARSGLVVDVGIELPRGTPEGARRARAAAVVPDARGDDTAAARHARHLLEAGDGVGHEVDDELRERGIEGVVGKRQVFRRRPLDGGAGMTLARSGDEGLRRIDSGDVVGPSSRTSSVVSAPEPQPTSSTRWPSATPASSASSGASSAE